MTMLENTTVNVGCLNFLTYVNTDACIKWMNKHRCCLASAQWLEDQPMHQKVSIPGRGHRLGLQVHSLAPIWACVRGK